MSFGVIYKYTKNKGVLDKCSGQAYWRYQYPDILRYLLLYQIFRQIRLPFIIREIRVCGISVSLDNLYAVNPVFQLHEHYYYPI